MSEKEHNHKLDIIAGHLIAYHETEVKRSINPHYELPYSGPLASCEEYYVRPKLRNNSFLSMFAKSLLEKLQEEIS